MVTKAFNPYLILSIDEHVGHFEIDSKIVEIEVPPCNNDAELKLMEWPQISKKLISNLLKYLSVSDFIFFLDFLNTFRVC